MGMFKTTLFWADFRWYYRVPLKWVVFWVAYLAVCFPYPGVLIRHIQHWSDPNAMLMPETPALLPLIEIVRSKLGADPSPQETIKTVEAVVYDQLPYDWDWNTWGVADYLPTAAEALEMGREDCDGRAVVAASLMQAFGLKASLVGNFTHIWVSTDYGDAMGPMKSKAIVVTEHGVEWRMAGLLELPHSIVYGISVFPLGREVILVVVLWVLFLRRDHRLGLALIGLAGLILGLVLLRQGGRDYRSPDYWLEGLGAVALASSVWWLVSRRCRSTTRDVPVPMGPGTTAD